MILEPSPKGKLKIDLFSGSTFFNIRILTTPSSLFPPKLLQSSSISLVGPVIIVVPVSAMAWQEFLQCFLSPSIVTLKMAIKKMTNTYKGIKTSITFMYMYNSHY